MNRYGQVSSVDFFQSLSVRGFCQVCTVWAGEILIQINVWGLVGSTKRQGVAVKTRFCGNLLDLPIGKFLCFRALSSKDDIGNYCYHDDQHRDDGTDKARARFLVRVGYFLTHSSTLFFVGSR